MQTFFWIFWAVASAVPMFMLLPHFGYNKFWAAACIVPVGTVVLLWLMAVKLQEMEKR